MTLIRFNKTTYKWVGFETGEGNAVYDFDICAIDSLNIKFTLTNRKNNFSTERTLQLKEILEQEQITDKLDSIIDLIKGHIKNGN